MKFSIYYQLIFSFVFSEVVQTEAGRGRYFLNPRVLRQDETQRKLNCGKGSGSSERYVACGRGLDSSKCNESPGLRPRDEIHEVRCCSETLVPGWDFTMNSGCSVYAASKVYDGGVCPSSSHPGEDYWDAEQICESLGGDSRLCTKQEVEDGCTGGTGCSHDNDLVWTSDRGGDLC